MRVDEGSRERYGAIVPPHSIQVLESATRNDDGSINVVPTSDIFKITQHSSTTVTAPPMMREKPPRQPYHRLPLQMITSDVARRANEGVPATMPLEHHPKQMSTLDELLLFPTHMDRKKGWLEKLTYPKQVGKPRQQPTSANMMLEHHLAVGGKQIIGEMRQNYSSMYDNQYKINEIPHVSGLLHTFDEELLTPICSDTNKPKGSARCIDNKPVQNVRKLTRVTPSNYCEQGSRIENYQGLKKSKLNPLCISTGLVPHKNLNRNSSGVKVNDLLRNKSTSWDNLDTGYSYKPLSTIHSSWYNGIEKPTKAQQSYSNLARNALYSPSKLKLVKARQHSGRYMIQPEISQNEEDTMPIYPSSKLFSPYVENSCQKEISGSNKRFCWGPKLHSISNESDKKLEIYMKEQSICHDTNSFRIGDNTPTSGLSETWCDSNQMITNVNYEITEFSVSLVPEDEKKSQDSTQEFDNESVLSNSGHLCEHLSTNSA